MFETHINIIFSGVRVGFFLRATYMILVKAMLNVVKCNRRKAIIITTNKTVEQWR